MQTIPTWEEYCKATEDERLSGHDREIDLFTKGNGFLLWGYLHPVVNPSGIAGQKIILPSETSNESISFERIIRESFPDSEIKAFETVDCPSEDSLYSAKISVFKESLIARVYLSFDLISTRSGRAGVFMVEPWFLLGEYQEQTKKCIEHLWPLIRAIEYYEVGRARVAGYLWEEWREGKEPSEKYQPGMILLVKDGRSQATGHPALRELGLNLPDKPLLVHGYSSPEQS